MTSPIIQLDAFGVVSSLVGARGEQGLDAAISFFDDVTRFVGPIPNRLVYDVMQRDERAEEYRLPRNYTGSILRNSTILSGVQAINEERQGLRGGDIDHQLKDLLVETLAADVRVVHNVTLIAEVPGSELGSEMPNIVRPVTTYSVSVVITEEIGFVVAAADLDELLFDFQMFRSEHLLQIITAIAGRAVSTSPDGTARSLIYTVGVPGRTYIHAALFGDEDNEWYAPFDNPAEDIEYSLVSEDSPGVAFATNSTDLATARDIALETNPRNLDSAIDSMATLSAVYLLRILGDSESDDKDGAESDTE